MWCRRFPSAPEVTSASHSPQNRSKNTWSLYWAIKNELTKTGIITRRNSGELAAFAGSSGEGSVRDHARMQAGADDQPQRYNPRIYCDGWFSGTALRSDNHAQYRQIGRAYGVEDARHRSETGRSTDLGRDR